VAEGGPAAAAGLKTGDMVVAINGRPITYWEDLERALPSAGGRPLELKVRRDGAEQTVTVTPRLRSVPDPIFREPRETWDIGAGPQVIPQISSVSADSPASRAGLQAGDVVIAVAGQSVYTPDELEEGIRSRPGQAFPITVERDGKPLTLTVTPDAVREKGPDGQERELGRIQAGIGTKAVRFEPYNPVMAAGYGAVKTWDMTILTVKGLWKLVSRQIDSSII
jgi:regulator of sigma E protease